MRPCVWRDSFQITTRLIYYYKVAKKDLPVHDTAEDNTGNHHEGQDM